MIDFPRQDQTITLCMSENSLISGMINIAGRSISAYLQGADPDIVMYDGTINGSTGFDTLILSKRQTLWINPGHPVEKDPLGNWKPLRFQLTNGIIVEGEIDITGYDRISDYLQNNHDRFYEVNNCSVGGDSFDQLFVARRYVLWKEPHTAS